MTQDNLAPRVYTEEVPPAVKATADGMLFGLWDRTFSVTDLSSTPARRS
jgi:hypothetical protein